MSVMNVLSLLGGLGMFLFGMKIMGDGLEKAAGNRLKKLLGIVTHNRVLAMLAGLVITAVIQSSSASVGILMALGAAGAISIDQAIFIVYGMNLGACMPAFLSAAGTYEVEGIARDPATSHSCLPHP